MNERSGRIFISGYGGAWLKADDFSLVGNGQPALPPEPVRYTGDIDVPIKS